MLSPGQTLTLTVEKPAAGGRMIARTDGQVVLVGGAIPGERVTARVERVGRGVAYADVVTVDEPSRDRRPAGDDPLCGGCLYAHITYARQLEVKGLVIEDALTRIGRLTLPSAPKVHGSPEAGYRMRARLHVREARIGFFREGTHEVCSARGTRQLREDTCDVLDQVGAGLRSLAMAGVRELEVSENIDASQRVVHFETEGPPAQRALAGLGLLNGLTGLTVSAPRGLGPRCAVLAGDPHVTDVLSLDGLEVRLRRHVLAFFQGNRYLLPQLLGHVMASVPRGSRVVDLYAGTGLFSIGAAMLRDAQVLAVEGDRAGAADLAANAEQTGGRVKPIHEPVESFISRTHNPPHVLIVDPPRTGMSNEALQGAIGMKAPVVVYVSCDVATLARDARKLVDAGYALDALAGFDLFPNTPHVETIATFRIRP